MTTRVRRQSVILTFLKFLTFSTSSRWILGFFSKWADFKPKKGIHRGGGGQFRSVLIRFPPTIHAKTLKFTCSNTLSICESACQPVPLWTIFGRLIAIFWTAYLLNIGHFTRNFSTASVWKGCPFRKPRFWTPKNPRPKGLQKNASIPKKA